MVVKLQVASENIIQIGETGFCINTDVLFSIGRKGTEILKSTDCQINKIVPVGSTFMENWINLKRIKNRYMTWSTLQEMTFHFFQCIKII